MARVFGACDLSITMKPQPFRFYADLAKSIVGQDLRSHSPHGSQKWGLSYLRLWNPVIERDLFEIDSRSEAGGYSFLCGELSQLASFLIHTLEEGIAPPLPAAWARSLFGPFPRFLEYWWSEIISPDGFLRFGPSSFGSDLPSGRQIEIVRRILQIGRLFKKLEVPATPAKREAAIVSWLSDEQHARTFDDSTFFSTPLAGLMQEIAEAVILDWDPYNGYPKHGPGAVAGGEGKLEKWDGLLKYTYRALNEVFPWYDFHLTRSSSLLEDGSRSPITRPAILSLAKQGKRTFEVRDTPVSKLYLVPKDWDKYRSIAAEPLPMQYAQQMFNSSLVEYLENVCPFTKGRVNFTNQEINRDLAYQGSVTRKWCTLDLTSASDLLTRKLVQHTFGRVKRVSRILDATRSTHCELPDGTVHELAKQAGMGSALTFSAEALMFWLISVASIALREGKPAQWRRFARVVFVYGDDIIVPSRYRVAVTEALHSCGLKVSEEKSFSDGYFRESCGAWYLFGEDITPFHVKTPWSGNPRDGGAFASYVSIMNRLSRDGYRDASAYLLRKIEDLWGPLPWGTPESPFPCRWASDPRSAELLNLQGKLVRSRYNDAYQRFEFHVYTLRQRKVRGTLTADARLLRQVLQPTQNPLEVDVPGPSSIARRWSPVW